MTQVRPGLLAALLTGVLVTNAQALPPAPPAVLPAAAPDFRAIGASERMSPFPLTPLPRTGPRPGAAGKAGEPAGVSPFPLPGDAWARSPDASDVNPPPPASNRRGAADSPGARPETESERRRMPTEREVGVPPFPYDPEARGRGARQCVRDCTTAQSVCAESGAPAQQCEGGFVLCTLHCTRASGPVDLRHPGD